MEDIKRREHRAAKQLEQLVTAWKKGDIQDATLIDRVRAILREM